MLIKKRLQINVIALAAMASAIGVILSLSLYRISRESGSARIAGELMVSMLERSTFRDDYIRNQSSRAREQWFVKQGQIGALLQTALGRFPEGEGRRAIREMIENNESIGKIFTLFANNREGNGLKPESERFLPDVEDRLLNQLDMRLYEEIIQGRMLLESTRKARDSSLRRAGWGIIGVLVVLIAVVVTISWTTSRAVADRVQRLRDGAVLIGEGNLDYRLEIRGDDEFADLSDAFNAMSSKLQDSRRSLEAEIAERKRAEEALRESEGRLRFALETSHIGAWDLDLSDHTANRSFEHDRIFGYGELLPQWTYEMFLEHVLPEDREAVDAKFRAATAAFRDWNFECRIRRTDGQVRSVLAAGRHRHDANGRPIRMAGIVQDITERKQAEEALREGELRVRAKLDAILSPEGDISTLDLKDMIDAPGIQSLMEDFYRLAGIPMSILDLHGKVLVGVGWQTICKKFHRAHPDTCAHCVQSDTQLSAGLAPGEIRLYKCKNHMWDIATPVFIGGKHVGNVFSGQFLFEGEPVDYEQFRAQARRYGFDQAEYLEALESVPRLSREGIDTGMAFFTKLTQMLSQLSHSNIRLARLLSERDRLADSLQKAHAQLQAHARKLEETNKELESFAYTISHDLRAPLRAINGFARMLADDYRQSMDEEAKRRLSVIETNALKMGMLIDDLLAYSRVSRTKLNVCRINMSSLVGEVVEMLKNSGAAERSAIRVAELPPAHGDRSLIRQVLANLLENGVKFSRNRSHPEIEVGSFEKDGEAVYFVKDNGVGFDMKYYGKLFGVFQRLVTDAQFEGTGVGLAIVHRLVTRHGGRVWAEAGPGKGATFFFTLGRQDRLHA